MKTTKSIWSTAPRKTLIISLIGVFFTFSTIGFANDIIQMGRQPTLRFGLGILLTGLFSVWYAVTGTILRKNWWKAALPIFATQFFVMGLLGNWLPDLPAPTWMGAAEITHLQSRLTFGGIAIIFAVVVGYTGFAHVSIAEGRRYFRVHAEMALAAEIHRVLVPTIDIRSDGFEFYGRSLPSGEVGGDLVDVFQTDRGWIAYIADVSGHGVAPGRRYGHGQERRAHATLVYGRKRSAPRTPELGPYPIKKPEMFVTFAYLAWNGERLQYSLAGHPPILHYHALSREISELACSNLPLGMFSGQQFVSGSVQCAPDDLFLLLTDGVLQVTNDKDEEFGLAGVKTVISAHAGNPPSPTLEAVLDATNRHGHAADDQSLLFVQCHLRTT
jgi:hypothetical protein